jgi:hypothetical protein
MLSKYRAVKVGVATTKSGPAMHTVSESGTAFAGPAGPSMPPMHKQQHEEEAYPQSLECLDQNVDLR